MNRQCSSCGFTYPPKIVWKFGGNLMGSVYLCAICADVILHGDKETSILDKDVCVEAKKWLMMMRHWLNTEEGGFYVFCNLAKVNTTISETENNVEEEGVNMITEVIRTSFAHVFQARLTPDGKRKTYSCCALIPKNDQAGLEQVNAAVKEAIGKGIEKGVFPKAAVPALRLPLRDGDKEFEQGTRGPEFKGHYFFNCSRDENNGAPGVVRPQNGKMVPILDPVEFYSGCYARLDVNFFPYNKAGNKGIGVGLNNAMFVRDGERLDGRMKAEDAFSQYTDLPEDLPDASTDGDVPF